MKIRFFDKKTGKNVDSGERYRIDNEGRVYVFKIGSSNRHGWINFEWVIEPNVCWEIVNEETK